MVVNKSHPKYPEYRAKCNDLAERQQKEVEHIQYPEGRNGPLEEIYRRYNTELKSLQKEYEYLFVEES